MVWDFCQFGISKQEEIFIETKNKVSYMVDNLSLSNCGIIFPPRVLKFSTISCFKCTTLSHGHETMWQCDIKSKCISHIL